MFRTDSRGIWTVVQPVGEIDSAVADEFHATVTEAGDWGRGCLAIDFSEVTFMDSSGISVIVAAHKQARIEGGQLVIGGLTDWVRRVLDVTGVSKIVDIRDGLDERQFPVESRIQGWYGHRASSYRPVTFAPMTGPGGTDRSGRTLGRTDPRSHGPGRSYQPRREVRRDTATFPGMTAPGTLSRSDRTDGTVTTSARHGSPRPRTCRPDSTCLPPVSRGLVTSRLLPAQQRASLLYPGHPSPTIEHMFKTRCPDCKTTVAFPELPGDATSPACGLRVYITDNHAIGRYPEQGWTPRGIHRRRQDD